VIDGTDSEHAECGNDVLDNVSLEDTFEQFAAVENPQIIVDKVELLQLNASGLINQVMPICCIQIW
jgi:hypothetical protein